MDPIYKLTNLRYDYDGRTVLDIPDLSVERGEILTLLGPSGAGKTTLLRLLNFIERSTRGTLEFDGRRVGRRIPVAQRRRVAAVYEKPALLGGSVIANINYGLSLRKTELSDAEMSQWLERLGLTALAEQSAAELSIGEAQRAALARALVVKPDVLLLDEPTNNLDPINVNLIEQIVLDEQQTTGMTVVLVTHDMDQAQRLGHRTGLMLGGRLVEIAPTEQFFSAPATRQAAAFLRAEKAD
ncbi:MAG: ATP-binding cassette domain-containing protein [Chloroflexota bacterium]